MLETAQSPFYVSLPNAQTCHLYLVTTIGTLEFRNKDPVLEIRDPQSKLGPMSEVRVITLTARVLKVYKKRLNKDPLRSMPQINHALQLHADGFLLVSNR